MKKKSFKRVISYMLVAFMVMGSLCISPFTALRAEAYEGEVRSVNIGAGVLEDDMNAQHCASVFFGKTTSQGIQIPLYWDVIGYNGEGVASVPDQLTLFAPVSIEQTVFGSDSQNPVNSYTQSALKAKLDSYVGMDSWRFNACDKEAMVGRNLQLCPLVPSQADHTQDHRTRTDSPYALCCGNEGSNVDNAKLWPLSCQEASELYNGAVNHETMFWLRSPGKGTYYEAFFDGEKGLYTDGAHVCTVAYTVKNTTTETVTRTALGVNPAMNMRLDSILYTYQYSADTQAVPEPSHTSFTATTVRDTTYYNGWKIALKSGSGFSATRTDGASGIYPGEVVQVDVTDLGNLPTINTDTDSFQISAMVVDSNNNVLAYGKAGNYTTGEMNVTIPEYEGTAERLLLFAENVSTENCSCYGTNMVDVSVDTSNTIPRNVCFGANVFTQNVNASNAAMMDFGNTMCEGTTYPMCWSPIGYGGNGIASEAGVLTFMSRVAVCSANAFDWRPNDYPQPTSYPYSYNYKESTLQESMNGVLEHQLNMYEKGVIVPRNLETCTCNVENENHIVDHNPTTDGMDMCDGIAGERVENALLWPLSAYEGSLLDPVIGGQDATFWLRSPGTYRGNEDIRGNSYTAAVWEKKSNEASINNVIYYGVGDSILATRPAFNMNTDSILFSYLPRTSSGDRSFDRSNFIATTYLNEEQAYQNTWEVALKVASGFTAERLDTNANLNSGTEVKVNISNLGNLDASDDYGDYQVSAMLVSESGEVVAYGRVGLYSTGTITFTIPENMGGYGQKKLYVFAEDINDDNFYSSLGTNMVDISAPYSSSSSPAPMPAPAPAPASEITSNFVASSPATANITGCVTEQQGPACMAAFKASTPDSFVGAMTFSTLSDNNGSQQRSYSNKAGQLELIIPQELMKPGRTFALIGVDKTGKTTVFKDTLANDNKLTTNIAIEGYAFQLIYSDVQGALTGGDEYVIQSGDSLSRIAAKLGVSVSYLMQKNNITNPNLIIAGKKLEY